MRNISIILLAATLAAAPGCDLDVPDLNNPGIDELAENPTAPAVIAAATGLLIGNRRNHAAANGYVAQLGILGREAYNFDQADPRFVGELLQGSLNRGSPFGGNFWQLPYANIRLANTILTAVDKVPDFSTEEKSGIRGFTKTIMALDLLEVITTRDDVGAVIDTDNPVGGELGAIADKPAVLAEIARLLGDGAMDLAAGGDEFVFPLSNGFAGFDTPETFREFNRGIRARVAAYQENYATVLTALGESFIDDMPMSIADLEAGAYYSYSTASGDAITGEIWGPEDPGSDKHEALKLPFSIKRIEDGKAYAFHADGRTHRLEPGKYSEWLPLRFRSGMLGAAKGIARVLITATDPDFELYMTPINIDPGAPALPISHPASYAIYLSKLMGSYATLGLAEDTWALNERVIDEQAFLDQAYLNHHEREEMFFNALEKTPRGVVACVFDASDRIQHMFYRTLVPDHPANVGRDIEPWKHVLEDMYARMDDLVGRTMEKLHPDDLLFVLSDHGFESFVRGMNINSWLRDEGYLVLKPGKTTSGDFFADVDWDKTRAYTVGLGGIYLNRKGRESRGIVVPGPEAEALKEEIQRKLEGVIDPERDMVAVQKVSISSKVYKGPYLGNGPDLLVGYSKGYRVSWAAATGGITEHVFEDNDKAWGGDHCIDPELVPGVVFCSKAITIDNPGLEDMAPTALAQFGLPIPKHMEGRVLV